MNLLIDNKREKETMNNVHMKENRREQQEAAKAQNIYFVLSSRFFTSIFFLKMKHKKLCD